MWKNELITIERYILKELGFSIYNIMDHPHKYILYFVKLLNGSNELAQVSWNYLNDSLRLDLNLRYNAEVIACAAIFLAIRKLQLPIPEYPPWWEVMNADLESTSSAAIKNNFSSLTVKGLNLIFLPVEGSFNSKIGVSILGKAIITPLINYLRSIQTEIDKVFLGRIKSTIKHHSITLICK